MALDGREAALAVLTHTWQVAVYDLATGGLLHVFRVPGRQPGDTADNCALAFSADGRRLASAGNDGAVLVWLGGTEVSLRTTPPTPQPEAQPGASDAPHTPVFPAQTAPSSPDARCGAAHRAPPNSSSESKFRAWSPATAIRVDVARDRAADAVVRSARSNSTLIAGGARGAKEFDSDEELRG